MNNSKGNKKEYLRIVIRGQLLIYASIFQSRLS